MLGRVGALYVMVCYCVYLADSHFLRFSRRREEGADVGIIVGGAAEEEEEEEVEEEVEDGQDLRWASNLVFSLSSSMILCSRLSHF